MIRMVSTPLRDPAKMGILRLLPPLLPLPHSATANWDYSTGDYVRTPSPFSIPTVVVRGQKPFQRTRSQVVIGPHLPSVPHRRTDCRG
ncbi:hypothetical protein BO82DRAFT_87153 [Aspergillus uvarum CBS 121591]|uniref:Uncharacterized protein n=1 Tax=Aspergillus uvarum CBS 121591 TaxID=1448315 RepID=A0A319CUX8_9EURO|nr:hypothetical protein BO82DRAFT_87153 [Aspergillus uvarum CBS 121591]PYH86457.1 hypothetical protein BO82DRAFT_87153 [Aspergillus uvarum CBS 121591]